MGKAKEFLGNVGKLFEGDRTREEQAATEFAQKYQTISAELQKLGCMYSIVQNWIQPENKNLFTTIILSVPKGKEEAALELLKQANISLPDQSMHQWSKYAVIGLFASNRSPVPAYLLENESYALFHGRAWGEKQTMMMVPKKRRSAKKK